MMIGTMMALALAAQDMAGPDTRTQAEIDAQAKAEAAADAAMADAEANMEAAAEAMEEGAEYIPVYQRRYVGEWFVSENLEIEGCSMMATFADRTSLYIRYLPRTSSVMVAFRNFKATSLIDKQKVSLNVFFGNKGASNRSSGNDWDDTEFTVAKDSESILFISQYFDDEILSYISRYELVGFFVDERIIDSFPLKKSALAVEAMKECAFKVAGLNPDDPFLK